MARKRIDESLDMFCEAIEQRNAAYLMRTVAPQAAGKIAAVGEMDFTYQGPVQCTIVDERPMGSGHLVTFDLGRGSFHQKLQTRWVPRGDEWIIADVFGLSSG